MAIKPVEYVNDSSTPGFAKAGDEKTITKTNANTIRKDADQGNTKDLTPDQETYLEGNVDYDTLDYTPEEMEKTGEQQINTKGEDGESLEEKDEKGGAAAAVGGAVAGAAGAAAAATTLIVTIKAVENGAKVGKNFPGGMLAAGIVAAAGGAAALACSFEGTFDPNLGERKNQTGEASNNNSVIQQYIDTLSSDMEMMNEDTQNYTELSAALTESQVETITEVGALQAEMMVYQSQGNTAKVAELKAKIEELQKTSEEDNKGPQEEMNGLRENIESYTGNNAEAAGVKTSGDTVAEFLKQGDQMKNFAKAAQIVSYVGVAAMAIGVVYTALRVGKDLAGIFTAPFAAIDNAGFVLFTAGGVMMGLAANNFGKIADSEGAAGSAGDEMAGYLASLQEGIDAQANYTETTSGGYAETDTAATETVAENQEAANEANGKGAQGAQAAQGGVASGVAKPKTTETPKPKTTEVPKTTEPPADVAA